MITPNKNRPVTQSNMSSKIRVQIGSSGWFIIYYLGVFRAIRIVFGYKIRENIEVHGISGGAAVGMLVMCNTNLIKVRRYILKCFRESKNPKHFPKYISNIAMSEFPQNAHTLVQNLRVYYFSITQMKVRSIPQSVFKSKESVIKSCMLSANVPGFCSFLPMKCESSRWEYGYDAGIATYFPLNRKVCKSRSIMSITPLLEFERSGDNHQFQSDCTICPRIRLPLHWAGFPPNTRVLELVEQLGFYDALCTFATISSNQGGTKPSEDVQQILSNKLRHFYKLREDVERELQQHIPVWHLLVNYVVHLFIWMYRFFFE